MVVAYRFVGADARSTAECARKGFGGVLNDDREGRKLDVGKKMELCLLKSCMRAKIGQYEKLRN